MRIKIIYAVGENAEDKIKVEKMYKNVWVGPNDMKGALYHVSVSGPYPVQVLFKFKAWVIASENNKATEETTALWEEGVHYIKEIWSEIS